MKPDFNDWWISSGGHVLNIKRPELTPFMAVIKDACAEAWNDGRQLLLAQAATMLFGEARKAEKDNKTVAGNNLRFAATKVGEMDV